MRTIKYRAWNKDTKEMFSDINAYSLLLDTEWSLWDTFGRRIEDAKKSNNGLKVNYKNGILMQFTGLKDKNGKEIYEGDIVEHNGLIGEVKWQRGMFIETAHLSPLESNIEVLEIIGNIYENPSKDIYQNPEL